MFGEHEHKADSERLSLQRIKLRSNGLGADLHLDVLRDS
jgi:hypothetical protein